MVPLQLQCYTHISQYSHVMHYNGLLQSVKFINHDGLLYVNRLAINSVLKYFTKTPYIILECVLNYLKKCMKSIGYSPGH